MPSFFYDLRYLQAGLDILENFLLSGDLYWPVGVNALGGETPYPQLSLGGLILAMKRSQYSARNPAEQQQIARIFDQIDELHQHWRTAWANKTSSELHSRLTQWRNFLEEYRENPEGNYDRYGYEIFRRVIIELLSEDSAVISKSDQEMLAGLDLTLKASLKSSEYIWDPEIQSGFPEATFWYLYGRLPKEISNPI